MQCNEVSVFDQLKRLAGKWTGINEDGNPVSITYRLTANNTVLVEDWSFHNGIEALTLYFIDCGRLVATHYCPLGNQPRLVLQGRSESGVLQFEFVSASNLPDTNIEHEHAFDLHIIDAGTLRRNETYQSNGISETNGTTFTRHVEPEK